MVQFTYPGGRFRASATTLKFLLEWAYNIQPSQHPAGPAWIEDGPLRHHREGPGQRHGRRR